MQSHQRDLRTFVVGIGIADQGRMVEKLIEHFAAVFGVHRRVDQLA